MKTLMIILALALGLSTLSVRAQDGGGQPPGDIHLVAPGAEQQLNLSADQQKRLAALEAETKMKLEKILTADQLKQLHQMRPMPPQGGPGGGQGRPQRPGRQ